MKLEVLISCMHQKDASIINRSNIQSDVLIINQCDEEKTEEFLFKNNKGKDCKCRIIYTKERGLSRSRNMALRNATGDICLVCDDDEVLESDYVENIIEAFEDNKNKDIIAFRLNHPKKNYPMKPYNVGLLGSAKIGSVQIAFRKSKIYNKVWFCEKMGSGTGNGGGEENKFLVDCIRKRLKIMYVPALIGSVAQTQSMWFNGYTEKYWVNRGWVAKMIYGPILGYIYLWYTLIIRSKKVDKTNKWSNHLIWLHKGFIEKR